MAILGLGKSKKSKAFDAPAQTASQTPRVSDLTVGDYANGMPRIRLGEFFNSLLRQLKWVVPLLLLGTAGIWFATKDLKRTYSGEGRVLVQLGSEYVYESVTSQNASQGLMLTPDHIVLNEIGIMKNADIIEKVVGTVTSSDSFGPRRFAKDAFEKINAARTPREEQNAWVDLYKEVESSFVVMPQPKSSIVDLVYKHEDPEVAVETLNLFIKEYLDARKQLFVEGSGDVIAERRRSTEDQLKANERRIANFLGKNGISDFASERAGVTKRTEDLRTTLNVLRGNMTETERALATVENQLRNTPEQIDLYVDDRTSQRVAAAELELKQLLAKYLPGSQPVRQKEVELAELKALQSSNAGRAAGGRRVGPNPVFQQLMTRRNLLQSQADSFREKEFTLQRQLDSADGKVRQLTSLSPTYQNLLRERETLDTRLKSYTAKEQEALINQDQAEASSENVRVVSWASRPRKGSNTRLLMFALGTVAWGFTLFMLALMRVFLDPKLYASSTARRAGGDRRANERQEAPPTYEPEPYQPAQPLPESVPAPAAFSAAPAAVAASAYDAQTSGAGPVEYQPGASYASSGEYAADPYSAQPYAQPTAMGYGNTAQDIYSAAYVENPYAAPEMHVQNQPQPQAQAQPLSVPPQEYVDSQGNPTQGPNPYV